MNLMNHTALPRCNFSSFLTKGRAISTRRKPCFGLYTLLPARAILDIVAVSHISSRIRRTIERSTWFASRVTHAPALRSRGKKPGIKTTVTGELLEFHKTVQQFSEASFVQSCCSWAQLLTRDLLPYTAHTRGTVQTSTPTCIGLRGSVSVLRTTL